MLAAIIFDVVIVAVMVWCGRFTARYAEQRGRSRRPWFLLGALFFPIPSIVLGAFAAPRRSDVVAHFPQ